MATLALASTATVQKADLDLSSSTLATADVDDLIFTLRAVRESHASTVPINVELEGTSTSVLLWARSAARIMDSDGDAYWVLDARVSDVVSAEKWTSSLNTRCALLVPIDAATDTPSSWCYLVD
ncbi:hypothetical protein ACXDF8_24930 [Mycolicibacterium sp. CBM1]